MFEIWHLNYRSVAPNLWRQNSKTHTVNYLINEQDGINEYGGRIVFIKGNFLSEDTTGAFVITPNRQN